MILAWVKMVAWAEFANVGLILVAVGIYGLIRSLSTAKPPGRLEISSNCRLTEVLRESERATEKRE